MIKSLILKEKELQKLKELDLEKGILNTESSIWVINEKNSPTKEKLVFKLIDAMDDGKIMGRKNYTIEMLASSCKYSKIEELVIPEYRVIVDGITFEYAMKLINNHKNVGRFINDENISLKDKIKYLKNIGEIVKKVEDVDNESFRMQFGDLNEFNFILDENDNMKVVDLDSAYIGQDKPVNMPFYFQKRAYYNLERLKNKYHVYKKNNKDLDLFTYPNVDYYLYPNDDSDLFCYNMMLLSVISKSEIYKENIQDYFQYLNYLSELGIEKDLIRSFKKLYIPENNINPYDMVELIPTDLEKAMEYNSFQKVKK